MLRRNVMASVALGILLSPCLFAQTAYYRHVIFDNSQRNDQYGYTPARRRRRAPWSRKTGICQSRPRPF